VTLTQTIIHPQVQEAADFVMRTRRFLPINHPQIMKAEETVRAAGFWSASEIADPPAECPEITLETVGVFSANDRKRTIYSIKAAGVEIGTAIEWVSGHEHYPWTLSLPAPGVQRGCRNREELMRHVRAFVWPGF
jgi:hypothetical protein